jgi:acid phosphatase
VRTTVRLATAGGLIAAVISIGSTSEAKGGHDSDRLADIDHIVVIYEENHSFDNLFGGWPGVDGLSQRPANTPRSTQVDTTGTPLRCLLQFDVNLTSPPVPGRPCVLPDGTTVQSGFRNQPFAIDSYIAPTDTTCPPPAQAFSFPNGVAKGAGLPGGCTRDLVHRFYQEQYQIDGGKMDRYTVGSDAAGLTQGYYETKQLPIYQYLHGPDAPRYAVLDRFFQAAFGGSFLNHQWLIAAATPTDPGAPDTLHSVVDADGFPANYPPLHPTTGLRDAALTVACGPDGKPPAGARVCGDWAVNTMQPTSRPFGAFGAKLPLQTGLTIGDELSAADVSWAWYAGGWSNAAGLVGAPGWTNGTGPTTCADPNAIAGATFPYCADALFQFHHQPFNYYANYAEGAPGRTHLKDEVEFVNALASNQLPAVSFVKPVGEENEHPGYASQSTGNDHLVDLIKAIQASPAAATTMIVVTYDEFGGQWDHVKPPSGKKTSDAFGPGTRIPTLVIAPNLPDRQGVDSASHDATSILATIEHRFGLAPLSTRDAAVNDLATVYRED